MKSPEQEKIERKYLEDNLFYKLMGYRIGARSAPTFVPSAVEGVNDMADLLKYQGGQYQQNRMIKDKRASLNKALRYSYQAASVKLVDGDQPFRALINPNKVKQDYDEKIISIGYESNYKPGDVFEWMNTGTYWLVYLQETTELAYFRANIRKCSYQIQWIDENGQIHSTYVALRGPVETQINYFQKNLTSVDKPNYSLNLLMPKNKETLTYFKRYAKFYITGLEEGDTNVCWRVEAVNSLSMPGVLEVTAEEYYINEFEDDGVIAGIGNVTATPIMTLALDDEEDYIDGPGSIRPKKTYTYKFTGLYRGQWKIDNTKCPVQWSETGDKEITLSWNSTYSGQFDLCYGPYTKTVVVESLF